MRSEITDFEDAVVHEAGKNVKVEAIVTRNPKDFKKGTLPVYSPEELLKKMDEEDKEATKKRPNLKSSHWSFYKNTEVSKFAFARMKPAIQLFEPQKYRRLFLEIDLVLGFRDELAP